MIISQVKPETIVRLSDGTFYYNYNITEKQIETEDGLQTIYEFIQVQLRGIPTYTKCVQAIIREYYTEDQEFDCINTQNLQYKLTLSSIKARVQQDFGIVSELDAKKQIVLNEVEEYDNSGAVNGFYLGKQHAWLDKATRVGLVNSINAEKAVGKETTQLWLEGTSFTLNCDYALDMLNKLEVYALTCYNKTAEHKKNIQNIDNLEDLLNYDYMAGYPDKISVEV